MSLDIPTHDFARPLLSVAPTLGLFSRLQAHNRISDCRSWAELFDAANYALSRDRSAWGDALAPSCAAFALWRGAAFIVTASSSVEMDTDAQGLSLLAEAPALTRASFACAKSLALRMISPMPFSMTDAPGTHALFADICSQARHDVDLSLASLRSSCRLGPPLNLAMHTPKGRCINLLVGTACWIALDDPTSLLQRAFLPSWSALTDSAQVDIPAHPGAERLVWAQAETQWRAALESGPFAYLACGPDGGATQAGAEAGQLARAAHAFRLELHTLGMPTMGLSGLGAYVNARTVGDMASAAFENSRFDLVFKAPFHPTFLHHEWTHALDQMTRANQASFPDAAKALTELTLATRTGRRDEEVFAAEIKRAALAELDARTTLSQCADAWGQTREPTSFQNGTLNATYLAQEALFLALQAADPNRIGYLPTIQTLWTGVPHVAMDHTLAARANHSLVAIRSARRVLGSLHSAQTKTGTSFLAVAESLEASNLDTQGYWTHEAEMLARTGEGRFCKLLPQGLRTLEGRIVIAGKTAIEHPMGSERQALSVLFDRWLIACGPMVRQAAAQRARQDITPPPAYVTRLSVTPHSFI